MTSCGDVADLLSICVLHAGGYGNCAQQCDNEPPGAWQPLSSPHKFSRIRWPFLSFAMRALAALILINVPDEKRPLSCISSRSGEIGIRGPTRVRENGGPCFSWG